MKNYYLKILENHDFNHLFIFNFNSCINQSNLLVITILLFIIKLSEYLLYIQ